MLLLKKVAGELVSPLSLCVLALALALVLLWFTRRQREGKLLATAAFLLLATAAYGWLGGPALFALERSYAPLAAVPPDVKWIVVLGGGTRSDPTLPAASRPGPATLARLVEGIRLQRTAPGSRLLLSGGPVFGPDADAESMATLALALGVAPDAIVPETRSVDTESQVRLVRVIVKGERFVLVTSAAHMSRSVALFRKSGMDPLPAPAHYLAASSGELTPRDFFPVAERIAAAQFVIHEYLGLAWARLSGSQ